MKLELTMQESELIEELLVQALRELPHEIHHTHARNVREYLEQRQTMLERVRDRLVAIRPAEAVA